ncbi:oocyte zinc finger protein XlCOF8.4-like [Thunnus maccoyii]|uniref:oocyte zinc finger protein XlCOF8.4-like n=1 Tax=Thunnus maccoyii TaxID=8240 RepID=UPI001C4B0FA2|nr:oocyte zinc finger protein XlCOF8.4-like [Thunnus maccoyii]
MSSVECLRELINERLTAAAEEIFRDFQKTIVEYEEEIDRQRRLLDIVWKPEIKLHRIELPQQHVCNEEEEVLTDHQLCSQERTSSLDLEDPEPPQIKEEQEEELCTSLEGEQLVLKQETDFLKSSPNYLSDHSDWTLVLSCDQSEAEKEPPDNISTKRIRSQSDRESSGVSEPTTDHQLIFHTSYVGNNQEHKSDTHRNATKPTEKHEGTSTLSRNITLNINKEQNTVMTSNSQPKLNDKPFKCNSCSKDFYVYKQLKVHLRTHTAEKPFSCTVCGKTFSLKRYLTQHMITHSAEKPYACSRCRKSFRRLQHLRIHMTRHTELLQQHVYNEEEEVFTDQQLCNQERNSSLHQEDPEPPQITEEQEEELCTSLEGEQLVLKQETDFLKSIPNYLSDHSDWTLVLSCDQSEAEKEPPDNISTKRIRSESDRESCRVSEPTTDHQLIFHTSYVGNNQEHKSDTHGNATKPQKKHEGTSTLTTNIPPNIIKQQNDKPFKCNSCSKDFYVYTQLKVHLRTHTAEKPFSCTVCGKRFSLKRYLTQHMITHSAEKPYACNRCQKSFRRLQNLQIHMRSHTEHVCNEEEEVLTDQQLCDQERNSSLDQEDPEPPQIKEEQEELCTSLEGEQPVLKQETETFMLTPTREESDNSEDQTLDLDPVETQSAAEKEHVVSMSVKSSVIPDPNREDQLLSHNSNLTESQDHKGGKEGDSGSTRNAEPKPKKRHHRSKYRTNNEDNSTTSKIRSNSITGKQCFKCDTCGKAFKCKSKLHIHLRVHTGEKPFPCNTCERRFSQLGALNLHMKVHTGVKPYNCKTCGKGFYRMTDMKRHMRTHRGEKPYPCNSCGRRFSDMTAVKVHMRIHTGEKPYPCNTCGKSFSQLGALKVHKRIYTGDKPYNCKTCGREFCCRHQWKIHMRTHKVGKDTILEKTHKNSYR